MSIDRTPLMSDPNLGYVILDWSEWTSHRTFASKRLTRGAY